MLLVGLSLCARAQIRDTLIVQQSEVTIELDNQGFHHVYYGDEYVVDEGAPELPVIKRMYYIPQGASNLDIEFSLLNEKLIDGTYNIYPSQGLIESNNENKNFIMLDSMWFDTTYPTISAEISNESFLFGYRVATVCIYPIAYDARTKRMWLRDIEITLNYTEPLLEDSEEVDTLRSSYRKNLCYDYVYGLVDNPDLMEFYEVAMKSISTFARNVPISMFQNGFPYPDFIIITSEELKSTFAPLAEWKTRRGVYTIIETVEYINSAYQGLDLCEKIRNYIIEKEYDWGEGLAILLGGGIDVIPSRTYNGSEGVEVTDIYYVDRSVRVPNLTSYYGSININSTIGRFPVENVLEAKIMVEKTIDYEKAGNDIDYSYINNNLICDAYRNRSIIGKDSVSITTSFFNMMRDYYNYSTLTDKNHWFLYDCINQNSPWEVEGIKYIFSGNLKNISNGSELSKASFIDAVENGVNELGRFHFIYHSDHGEVLNMGMSSHFKQEFLTWNDVENMNFVKEYYQVVFSKACHPANFTTSCIGKSFLMHPHSGAVAYIGNVDVGRQSEYTGLKYFYQKIYGENNIWDWDSFIGTAWLNVLNASTAPKCKLHLLGDPTLAFWTDVPIEQSNQITTSDNTITISRPNTMYGKGATVCIHKENEIYMVDTIRYQESISFSTVNAQTSGYIYITSTGLGLKPQIDSVYIDKGENNLIEITNVEVTDNDFANDGILSAGEQGIIKISYTPLSNEAIDPSKLSLSCTSTYINILSNTGSVIGTNQLAFSIQAEGGTPEMNEHNYKSPLCYVNYLTEDNLQCVGYFHINVAELKGDVRNVSYDLLSNTNGYEYRVNVDYYLSCRSLAPQTSVRLKNPSSSSVQLVDSIVHLSSILLDGDVFKLSYIVKLNNNADIYKNVSFDIELTDIPGNIITETIYPFKPVPSAININSVTYISGATYIDLFWSKDDNCRYDVYASETGTSYQLLNKEPLETNCFRHADLEPQTTYFYKIRKYENKKKTPFSSVVTCTTACELTNGYPKIVTNMGGFKGLLNAWDVDLDGKKEVFAGCWDSMDSQGIIVAEESSSGGLFNETGVEIVDSFANVNGYFQNGPAIGELHDDGDIYIISSTYNDYSGTINGVYSYSTMDKNGDSKPDMHWRYESDSINAPRSPIIADLDGDDINEVIVPSQSCVTIFNADGTSRKVITCALGYKHIAVASIIPNSTEKQLIIPNGNKLSVFNKEGEILTNYSITLTKEASTPVVCDYLCNGGCDIIVGDIVSTDSVHIYVVDYSSGTPTKEKLFANTFKSKGREDAAIAVCDLNNDDALELVSMGENQLIIYDYDNPGNLIKVELTSKDWYDGTPIIADIDGDNYADVIYQSCEGVSNRILAVDRFGNSINSVNQSIYGTINDGLMAEDIDGDGFTEIVAGTVASRLYIWKTKGNADYIEWGSARGNAQNTGEYGLVNYPQLVRTTTVISSDYDFEHDIYIVGGQLDITGNLTFPSHRKIVVWENGTLNINGATLNNARIVVKPGGKVNITNGATINLRDTKSLVVPKGARLNISQGVIK